MRELNVNIPDFLYNQVTELPGRENISLDQLVAIALSAQVSAWMTQDYLVERAKRGSWEQFQEVLMKVPDVEPEELDKL
ncbi:hypothetical protein [Laspinema olomoucense]|uniref:CopG family transcriptional regulator n=1 Tax=Laspinema olomoucense D3b TaxID=2953688 RepID=A0ABT2NCS6_9CYAN|nr:MULTISPECIES: hypothetical protein [unclassified Laspinema]MCT7980501.1 hypothetical protein [Laspinema sp. D3b]MCT7995050.1 hypothetical protein [Laspinema sp. D3c]